MITHIVLWKLRDEADNRSKKQNLKEAIEILEGMRGNIPGVAALEVGQDFGGTPSSADLALVTKFENKEALEAYRNHPAHEKVKPFIKTISSSRMAIDYESNI